MFRKTVSGIIIGMLLTGLFIVALNVQPVKSDYTWTQTIYIQADGSISPPTAPISSVDNVTYTLTDNITGNVTDNIAIIIQRNNIALNGAGHTLQGINDPLSCGIWTGGSNIIIENMKVTAFWYGIYLLSSSNNGLDENNITENSGYGIYLNSSSNNSFSGNNITNNTAGIWLSSSSNNKVLGNKVLNNIRGIGLESSSYSNVSGNIIMANGFAGVWLDFYSSYNNVVGNNITANTGDGINLASPYNSTFSGNSSSSTNNIVGNNIKANSWNGIAVGYSSNNSLSGNNIAANGYAGVMLDLNSSYNNVVGNNITANTDDGIYLDSSSNNSFSGNNVTNNNYGIELHFSSNNIIYHNNFVNNTSQTSSSGSTNVWDNGYPSGGNFWSGYAGTDLYSGPYQNETGSDGIGDTPYGINGNNTDQDHYPLMQALGSVTGSLTSVFCSPNPVSRGSPVTCTATVSGFNPTGTVTWSTSSSTGFFNQSVCNLSNGTCSTTYTDNFTGSMTIAAYYSGDSNNIPSSGSTILTVTSGGPVYYSKNYTTVQAAINAAPPGATVIIASGVYSESLTVNKTLTIIGEKDPPIFSGGGSGVCITLLSGASGSVVTGIVITSFNEGVSVVNASNCGIYCNIFASLGDTGIMIEGSTAINNAIYNNLFQDTPTPIELATSTVGNTVHDNMINSQATVTLNVGASGNMVYENVVSGNQIVLNVANSANVIYHNDFLATAQITVLATGNNAWDDGYPSGGNYWSTYSGVDQKSGPYQNVTGADGIGDTPYVIATNSTDRYPLMKPWTTAAGHSVAVMSVLTAKRWIGQGFSCNVTVVVADDGEYAETFNVTCYASDKALSTRQINNLQAMCPLILTFTWNTLGLAYGNYTLSAYAWPVPGETNMANNNFTGGIVKVTVPGDLNGDGIVDIYDAITLAGGFNTNPGNSHWNANADINSDNAIDIYDAIILANHFNQHYP